MAGKAIPNWQFAERTQCPVENSGAWQIILDAWIQFLYVDNWIRGIAPIVERPGATGHSVLVTTERVCVCLTARQTPTVCPDVLPLAKTETDIIRRWFESSHLDHSDQAAFGNCVKTLRSENNAI